MRILRTLATLAVAFALAAPVAAQALTNGQLNTVCTAVKANGTCNPLRLAGGTNELTSWLNAARSPTVLAWFTAAPALEVEAAPSYTSYDTLAQGKRDSWAIFVRNPRDFTRTVTRNWVVDIWGNATASSNAEKVLLAATFSASNVQNMLGGTTRTTGTVSALDLTFPFAVPTSVAEALVNPARCQ